MTEIKTNASGEMRCPLCEDTNVHITEVEADRAQELEVTLHGWCESCLREFRVLFTNHRGTTLVSHVDHADVEI